MNKCDWDETKHQALQKFLKLANMADWVRGEREYYENWKPALRGAFTVREQYPSIFSHYGERKWYEVLCRGETIHRIDFPRDPSVPEYISSFKFPTKKPTKKVIAAYEKQLAAIKASPEYIACRKVFDGIAQREEEAATQKKCMAVMEALKPRRASGVIIDVVPRFFEQRRWWQFWK